MDKWTTQKGPGTHVLMDGGILQVPFEKLEEFYTDYIHLVRTGKRVYVVEQKTEVFKFFIDLDYKDSKPLSEPDVLDYVRIMNGVVKGKQCVIARAKPRKLSDGSIKSGVHIVWPDVIVKKTEALALRTRILLELPDDPEWNQRIDSSVYGGSGLRMVWSHKKERGKDTDPYIPWMELDGQIFDSVPTKELLELFAIRTNESSVGMNVEITCTPLERFIQKNLKGQKNAGVKRVIRKGNDMIIVQTDSHYCENIQGEHKSNHVWFSISKGKICQLCHDEDCKPFVGQEHKLSPTIIAELKSNVAVDNSSYVPICNLVPDFWWKKE